MRPCSHPLWHHFALPLKHGTATEGVYLCSRSDSRLFNLAQLKAKTKVHETTIRDMLFADDAAVTSHTEKELQCLVDRFYQACKDFGLTISLKKTDALSQDVDTPLAIYIDDYQLEVVHQFTYLGSTISDNLSLDAEISKRISKAATTLGRLTTRVWENPKLTIPSKMAVYNACIISNLLYGSETWTTYSKQERKLNSFHMRCLRRILGIHWSDKVPNAQVLERAGLTTMFTLLRQRRLGWLGHVRRMEDGRIPKDVLYGELASGKRTVGRPQLRYKSWEDAAADRNKWRCVLRKQLKSGEEKIQTSANEKRAKRKARIVTATPTSHTCKKCGRDCHSRIGLISHSRRCP